MLIITACVLDWGPSAGVQNRMTGISYLRRVAFDSVPVDHAVLGIPKLGSRDCQQSVALATCHRADCPG